MDLVTPHFHPSVIVDCSASANGTLRVTEVTLTTAQQSERVQTAVLSKQSKRGPGGQMRVVADM